MHRSVTACCALLGPLLIFGQPVAPPPLLPFTLSEEIGLAMNRTQVMAAAVQAWDVSFGQQPGARQLLADEENGTLEGTARVNYRSTVITYREETMGSITFMVSIQARNGQCNVRVHGFRHTGNRHAPGGGLDFGILYEGVAPHAHYPGMGLSLSRKLHADARKVAIDRVRDVLRTFSARLRSLGGQ